MRGADRKRKKRVCVIVAFESVVSAMNSARVLLLIITSIATIIGGVKEVYVSRGDISIALILRNCRQVEARTPFVDQTLVNAAIWTTQRLNFLDFTAPFSFGVSVYQSCSDNDDYNAIFEVFQRRNEEFFMGLITDGQLDQRVQKFSDVLELKSKAIVKCVSPLIRAAVSLLGALNWNENITVVAPNELIISEFFKLSRTELICITETIIYRENVALKNSTGNFVIFGDHSQLTGIIQLLADPKEESSYIFVPLDGSVLNDLPQNSYVIIPPHAALLNTKTATFLPTPILFDVAIPMLSYAQSIWHLLAEKCNNTTCKLGDLSFHQVPDHFIEPESVVEILKIEPLKSNFAYNIFKAENGSQPYTKTFIYNMFDRNLTALDPLEILPNVSVKFNNFNQLLESGCKNALHHSRISDNLVFRGDRIRIRTESWVFAFLSISLLGVLFCIAILVFLLVAICRRNILEGNPLLTMLLLISVMLMYCSILPLALEGDKSTKETICLARSLAITLSFASAFALILSRSILLATASKDIGFMSHIAGPVQSFLCLFIFGVQAALSLQVIGHCNDIFRGHSFIYLLSYNAMLLLLLLCLCPLIMKCQRNYREGKYFTVSAVLVAGMWCIWVPGYALMGNDWKDPLLCFGLVSTASVLMGAIFVPRTYLMTIAAARDKIASTLPSMATATSAMDIYRAGTQPVYDCVNVAAINAVAVARAGMASSIQQPDLYCCPNMPDEEEDFDLRCDTPISNDKVTRF